MKHIPPDDILQLGLGLLKVIGERMHYSSIRLCLFRAFNLGMLLTNLFFIASNLPHSKGSEYIKTTEGVISMCHAIFKYSLFIYHKKDIEQLLDDTLNFWDIKEFNINLRSQIKNLYRRVKYAQNYYNAIWISSVMMFFLKPVLNANNRFLFECWTYSHSFELETFILSGHYYFLVIAYPIIFGYDSLYFAYCVHIIVQVRFLKNKFEDMTESIMSYEIGNYIKHHQLILSIFNRMNRVYFWMFLFHYFVTLITGCSQLYAILLGTTGTPDLVVPVIYITALLVQFAYYSFPVEEIVFELKDLSRAIYMSSWYERDTAVKKMFLFVMTKAQRQKYLSAGGIIDINVDAFGSVVRKAFSFYAILKNVIGK